MVDIYKVVNLIHAMRLLLLNLPVRRDMQRGDPDEVHLLEILNFLKEEEEKLYDIEASQMLLGSEQDMRN